MHPFTVPCINSGHFSDAKNRHGADRAVLGAANLLTTGPCPAARSALNGLTVEAQLAVRCGDCRHLVLCGLTFELSWHQRRGALDSKRKMGRSPSA